MYVDHYEIQEKRHDGDWEHVANVYPRYFWSSRRPWYYLWLRRVPVILNEYEAHTTTLPHIVRILKSLPDDGIRVRLVTWMRDNPLRPTHITSYTEFHPTLLKKAHRCCNSLG